MAYQFPNLVMSAEGNLSARAAGTFPEKDGRTETKKKKRKDSLLNNHVYK